MININEFLQNINQTGFEDLYAFILNLLNVAILVAALLAVIVLVWAGLQYIISRGEGEKAEKAQQTIVFALIGLVMVFISPLLVRYILNSVLQV